MSKNAKSQQEACSKDVAGFQNQLTQTRIEVAQGTRVLSEERKSHPQYEQNASLDASHAVREAHQQQIRGSGWLIQVEQAHERGPA